MAMYRMKRALVVLVIGLTLGAVGAAQASAASWFIGGVKLSTGSKVAVASKTVVDEKAVFNVPGLGLKVSCAGSTAIAATLVGENKGESQGRTFEACSEIEPSTCKVEPSNIITEPLSTTLSTSISPTDRFLLVPKTGKTFATVLFRGSCSFAGEQPIKGAVIGKLATGQTEELAQAVEGLGSSENNSLEFDSNKMFIERGKALVTLVSGSKWSFH